MENKDKNFFFDVIKTRSEFTNELYRLSSLALTLESDPYINKENLIKAKAMRTEIKELINKNLDTGMQSGVLDNVLTEDKQNKIELINTKLREMDELITSAMVVEVPKIEKNQLSEILEVDNMALANLEKEVNKTE